MSSVRWVKLKSFGPLFIRVFQSEAASERLGTDPARLARVRSGVEHLRRALKHSNIQTANLNSGAFKARRLKVLLAVMGGRKNTKKHSKTRRKCFYKSYKVPYLYRF